MDKVFEIEQVVKPVLAENHFELIETQYRREAGRWVLRLLIDGETRSVTLDDCGRMSDAVGNALDAKPEILGDSYVLEVSSPGINRPLKTEAHFRKAIGKNAKVILDQPLRESSAQKNFTGIILDIKDGVLELNDATSGRVEIPLSMISKAHLDLV